MAGKSIVILGAGFGGITAALELRRALGPEHSVILVDRRPVFMMGLRKLWMLVGRGTRQEGTRSLEILRRKGIDLRRATVQAIDLRGRQISTDAGGIHFDYLIVALGAESRPDLVPGFSPAAFNLYDADDVERLASRLRGFSGGRVAIGILGLPYKCPPAPYEAAMMLHGLFTRRGIRSAVELAVFTPQPMSLPVVGAAGCAAVEGQLGGKGITFTPNRKASRLEGTTVIFEGATLEADVLIGVPPHRPPAVVRDAGLAMRGEWIAADPATLRTSVDGVFAVGDVVEIPLANTMPLPKAGVFAEAQGRVAATGIAAEITGTGTPEPFDGHGYCFIESGDELASVVTGNFLAAPAPQVEVRPPTASAYDEKIEFEQSRLRAWFTDGQ